MPETMPLWPLPRKTPKRDDVAVTRATVTLEVAGLAVAVPAPQGAEFGDLEGLPADEQHLSWSPGSGRGAFMVSTGGGRGHTADGLIASEREHSDAVEVERDEIVAGPAGPARRVALRSRRQEERAWVQGEDGRPVEVPEHEVEEELEFIFATGPDGAPLRIGYRVPVSAPAEVRAMLRRMLDETRVEPA